MNKTFKISINLFSIIFLVLCILFLGISIGGNFICPEQIFNELFTNPVIELRFFRLLTAFTVGAALAVSGVAYQAVLRNPLAEPYILGISGGASIGAAVALASGIASLSYFMLPLSAFIGAITVLTLVLLLAGGNRMQFSDNIMLSGIIIGTLCSSILMFMISVMRFQTFHSITWWMLGNLQPGNRNMLLTVIVLSLGGLVILFLFARDADVLSMGEETAFNFGISPKISSLTLLITASILAASAVSLSGIIGFVGLIIPHILRRIFGAGHRKLFPISFFFGGIFLVICDTFARTVLYPKEIPVGVITACIGGPVFIYLINRKNKLSV